MTNKNRYNVGDVVKLKSGGPEMTVQVAPTERDAYYQCQWFAGKQLSSGRFREESLAPVQPTAK